MFMAWKCHHGGRIPRQSQGQLFEDGQMKALNWSSCCFGLQRAAQELGRIF
jgi:hypothetical protein